MTMSSISLQNRRFLLAAASLAALTLGGASAQAQSVNIYCSVQIEWCQAIATNFQRDTGIKVNMTQKGSGEMLAQIRAEAQNPRGDVWFGGTGDPHLAAAEENLTVENESKNIAGFPVAYAASSEGTGFEIGMAGTIAKSTYMGAHTEYTVSTPVGDLFVIAPDRLDRRMAGDTVGVTLADDGVILVRP